MKNCDLQLLICQQNYSLLRSRNASLFVYFCCCLSDLGSTTLRYMEWYRDKLIRTWTITVHLAFDTHSTICTVLLNAWWCAILFQSAHMIKKTFVYNFGIHRRFICLIKANERTHISFRFSFWMSFFVTWSKRLQFRIQKIWKWYAEKTIQFGIFIVYFLIADSWHAKSKPCIANMHSNARR